MAILYYCTRLYDLAMLDIKISPWYFRWFKQIHTFAMMLNMIEPGLILEMVHRVVSRLSHSRAFSRLLCKLGRGWQIISIIISSGISERKCKLFIDFLNAPDKITDSWGCSFLRDFGCLWSSDSCWSIEEVEVGASWLTCSLMVGASISCIGLWDLTSNDGAAEVTTAFSYM